MECTKVDSKDALVDALRDAGKYSDKILVEEFIVGREVAVGLISLMMLTCFSHNRDNSGWSVF